MMTNLALVLIATATLLIMGLGLSREATTTATRHLLPYYRHFNRLSSLFAVITDVALLNLNAKLKFKEMLSARLGDLLSMLYLGGMVIEQHEERDYLLYQYQVAFDHLMQSWPNRLIPANLRGFAVPIGRHFAAPKESLEKSIVDLLTNDSATRRTMTGGLFMEVGVNNLLAEVNQVFLKGLKLQPLLKRLTQTQRTGQLIKADDKELADTALKTGMITEHEAEQLRRFDRYLMTVIHDTLYQNHRQGDLQQITG
jgi:acyl-CoA dehydrogenase